MYCTARETSEGVRDIRLGLALLRLCEPVRSAGGVRERDQLRIN